MRTMVAAAGLIGLAAIMALSGCGVKGPLTLEVEKQETPKKVVPAK